MTMDESINNATHNLLRPSDSGAEDEGNLEWIMAERDECSFWLQDQLQHYGLVFSSCKFSTVIQTLWILHNLLPRHTSMWRSGSNQKNGYTVMNTELCCLYVPFKEGLAVHPAGMNMNR